MKMMKDEGVLRFAVFADSHGNAGGIRQAIEENGTFHGIIHLGDGVEDGHKIAREKFLRFYGVAGNEDYCTEYPEKHLLIANSIPIMLIHGHQIDINPYQEKKVFDKNCSILAGIAHREGVQVLFFGHTHTPLIRIVENVLLFNPGEMYVGSSRDRSFGIMEVRNDTLVLSTVLEISENDWDMVDSMIFCINSTGRCEHKSS